MMSHVSHSRALRSSLSSSGGGDMTRQIEAARSKSVAQPGIDFEQGLYCLLPSYSMTGDPELSSSAKPDREAPDFGPTRTPASEARGAAERAHEPVEPEYGLSVSRTPRGRRQNHHFNYPREVSFS